MARSTAKWVVFAALLAACGADSTQNNSAPTCPDGASYNPILGDCIRVADNNTDVPIPGDDVGEQVDPGDLGGDDAQNAQDDVGTTEPDLGCQTDNDGDGAIAIECGGDDCDDNDPRRAPHLAEVCDEVDNNCDGEINEDLNCSVLAHSDTRLYRVDFFAGTIEDLGPTIPNLYDIDTHPNGTTYGIADSTLYTYNEAAGTWTPSPGTLGFLDTPNGFCIDNEGNAYITGGFTLRSVNLAMGTSSAIGSLNPTVSSGDCVVNKGNLLFMTSSHTSPDSFARLNGGTGAATVVGLSQHDAIWGLTAAWSRVFGLTASGDVVEINVSTGATTLIASYPGISFYGAASTPLR